MFRRKARDPQTPSRTFLGSRRPYSSYPCRLVWRQDWGSRCSLCTPSRPGVNKVVYSVSEASPRRFFVVLIVYEMTQAVLYKVRYHFSIWRIRMGQNDVLLVIHMITNLARYDVMYFCRPFEPPALRPPSISLQDTTSLKQDPPKIIILSAH